MRTFLLILMFTLSLVASTLGQTRQTLQGDCERGNNTVLTDGRTSITRVQKSYPSCTITVYDFGTVNLASIASDLGGTPKSNPFQADVDGHWLFWALPGRYDVRFSDAGIPTPYTRQALWIASGGGGTFPQASYVTLGLNPDLTNERVLTAGTNITLVDTGPNGTITINATGGGGGSCPGTSTNTQVIYNNVGACAGIANAVSLDGTTLRVTSGDFITDLRDTNHLAWLAVSPAASAVNYTVLANAATGNAPTFSVTGSDSNVNFDFDAKGTGQLRWKAGAHSIPSALTDAATITTDASLSNRFEVTIQGNRLLANPSNAQDGQQIVFNIIQDGTGGHTLTFDTKFVLGAEITSCVVSTTPLSQSFFSVIYRSGPDRFFIVSCVTGYVP